ncbi:hypothetical protein H8E52_03855 [bacterium]|nr:hypothetical protein [bacterium]
MKKWFLILAPTILLAGCSDLGDPVEPGGGGDPDDTPVSFSDDLWPILENRCLSCHNAGNPSGGFILDANDSPVNLVDMESTGYAPDLLVESGSKENSVLYLKLVGDVAYGQKMPLGGTLSASEVAKFGSWIDAGAQDN